MMLVLLLCVIMKIAEFSVGRVSPPLQAPTRPPQPCCNKRKRRDRRQNRKSNDKCKCCFQKRAGKGTTTMEDPQTPGSDCNSNPATDPISQDLIGSEFVQDNSEYQWFIDSYRDGGLHVHPSVLSSLSASYTRDDLGYYDDLARNLDANLAEVDMESFRTADIHTLLTALPVMCTEPVQHSEFNYQRERYASISGSVMEKLDIGSSISPHTSQGEESACSTTDTISICKSSLLFSPVKETPVLPPGGSYSVDSLDCEDMLLTCQTNNKNNYTIAFEGSIAMYSDGSQDFEGQDKQKVYEAPVTYCDKALDLKNILNLSMACSDSKIYTTWSNLKHSSINKAMTRHPSGNNNTIPNFLQGAGNVILNTAKRSQSLPDLSRTDELQQINIPLNFSVDSAASSNHTGPLQSSGSVMSRSVTEESSDSVGNVSSAKKIHNMSLVKLFMKQKSMSAEGMSLTLDQSDSVSENGWPTSNSDSGTNTQIHRHNINSSDRRELADNDFSINWVKTDHYTETQKDNFSDIPKQTSTPRDSKKESSSTSVEEFTDSTLKSTSALDSHPGVERRPKSAWSDTQEKRFSRTMGIQAITEVEDNAVQTSLVYPIPEEKASPSFRETFVDKKSVYVVYPNYTLPDLSFLNSVDGKFENVALKPQNFNKDKTWKKPGKSNRPFSCNDIDALKQRGFSHVKDWESLTFLLPNDYKKILHEVPEVSRHIKLGDEVKRPLFCLSPPMRTKRRTFNEITNNASSSSSTATQPSSGYRGSSTLLTDSSTNQQGLSNATNPLYLYRYDSASSETSLASQEITNRYGIQKGATGPILPKRSISLPQGEKDSGEYCSGKVPPRPPLPRSILRKNRVASKRCSMFEMGDVEEVEDKCSETNKRMSLPEPYYINNDLHLLRNGRIDDSDKDVDETEERYQTEKLKEVAHRVDETMDSSEEDVKQLEDFLKRSGFSSQSSDGDEDSEVKLRSYVRKFLALRMNKDILKNVDMGESQKKTVSFATNQRKYLDNNVSNLEPSKDLFMELKEDMESRPFDLDEKRKMIWPVNKAMDILLKYWHSEPVRSRQGYNDNNECSQLCLGNLCPPLYAIMSDGLKPQLNSTFGPIANSVWQVVEASSQQGPLTKTLNELVQRINGEDFITEGLLKFHAFVFGLLNLRALDAWFAYLCTRESILRKHYNNNSLFVRALSCGNSREVIDAFLDILQPLAFCPFQLDLLYQYRQLHNSFGNRSAHSKGAFRNESSKELNLESNYLSPRKARPRSCINYGYDEKSRGDQKADNEKAAKKRWSHLPLSSKFHFDRIGSEDSEEYTDSLEHSPLNRASAKPSRLRSPELRGEDEEMIPGDLKFRKLQEKWELMLGKEDGKEQVVPPPSSPNRTPTSIGKSKIPRLLASPIKTSNLTGIPGKNTKSPVSGIPALKKTPGQVPKALPKKPDTRGKDVSRRTSRVDQETVTNSKTHLTRPSSLPYKTYGVTKDKNLDSPHRRAASTSLPRPTSAIVTRNVPTKHTPKLVRTLTHRYSSDDGHLAFSEGEKLKVILEVDNKWLLCARGERKGLVPRTCVHALQT